MADECAKIEAFETGLMRAWVGREQKVMRKLLSPRFRMVVGGSSPVLLDRKSLIDAVGDRWLMRAFRFGANVYVREAEGLGIFAAEIEVEATIDGADASGRWWLADCWRKSTIGRSWKLLDRQISRSETDSAFAQMVRPLQLWR